MLRGGVLKIILVSMLKDLVSFYYKNPAIFAENVKFLLGKGYGIYLDGDEVVIENRNNAIEYYDGETDIEKAVALACIKAEEEK